ncbi:6987_t:CDS:10, partial [Funneliformis caledonium]
NFIDSFVRKKDASAVDRDLSEASKWQVIVQWPIIGKSSSSGWPALSKQQHTSTQRNIYWMISCNNPIPIEFFRFIQPTHKARAIEKYGKTLDQAINLCKDSDKLSKLKNIKESVNCNSDWNVWLVEKRARSIRDEVYGTNTEVHRELNAVVRKRVIVSNEESLRKRQKHLDGPYKQLSIKEQKDDEDAYSSNDASSSLTNKSCSHTFEYGENSKRTFRNRTPLVYIKNLNETDFSESDHEEKEIDKRKRYESDYDSDYEPRNNYSISSNSDHNQKKKMKSNKGKQPESKERVKHGIYDNKSASSLNSTPNNVTTSQDLSMFVNQEQLPTVLIMKPTTQIPKTPSSRPNINNANTQITPQKSVLFQKSVTYLQNHIKMNVNDQGMIIKDNHESVDISSTIRNWLVTALSSSNEEFIKAITAPLSIEASKKDHKFRQICEFVLYDFYFTTKEGSLKRNIGERTFIVERIVPLFKAIQSVYREYNFHWIETELDCMREVKKLFPQFDLTINQADGLGIRNSSNKEILFIEVSGGPESTDSKHAKEDAEKLLKEAVFGLVSLLRNHLDKSAEISKHLYTFTIQSIGDRLTLSKLCLINKHCYSFSQIKSARLPFGFIDIADFLEVFELLYIIVSELEIQTGVINKLKLSKSVNDINVPKIRDWIWLPDSVSAWECKDSNTHH